MKRVQRMQYYYVPRWFNWGNLCDLWSFPTAALVLGVIQQTNCIFMTIRSETKNCKTRTINFPCCLYRDCAVVFKPESSWSTIIDHQDQETRTKFCPPELSIWDLPDLQKVSSWIVSIYRFYVLLPAHRIALLPVIVTRARRAAEECVSSGWTSWTPAARVTAAGTSTLATPRRRTSSRRRRRAPWPWPRSRWWWTSRSPRCPRAPSPCSPTPPSISPPSSTPQIRRSENQAKSEWRCICPSDPTTVNFLSALRFLTNMQFCLLFIWSRQCLPMRCCHCNANGLKNVAAFFDLNIYNCVPGIWKSVKYVWITSPRGPSKIRSSLWRNSWSRCSTTSTAPSMHFSNPCSRGTSSPYFPKRWNIAAATSTCVARYWYALLRFQRDT